MKTISTLNKALLISTLATAITGFAAISHADDKMMADMGGKEKCYGIAKAGKNDCAGSNNSCAGMTKKDGEGFLAVPKGLCEKLVGATLEAPAKK